MSLAQLEIGFARALKWDAIVEPQEMNNDIEYREKPPIRDSFSSAREVVLPPHRPLPKNLVMAHSRSQHEFEVITSLREREIVRIRGSLAKIENLYRRLYGAIGLNAEGLTADEQYQKDVKVHALQNELAQITKVMVGLVPGCSIGSMCGKSSTLSVYESFRPGKRYWLFHPTENYIIGVYVRSVLKIVRGQAERAFVFKVSSRTPSFDRSKVTPRVEAIVAEGNFFLFNFRDEGVDHLVRKITSIEELSEAERERLLEYQLTSKS